MTTTNRGIDKNNASSPYGGLLLVYEGESESKGNLKLRGNRDREELAHCAILTMPVEEFSHVHYSALSSVEWQ